MESYMYTSGVGVFLALQAFVHINRHLHLKKIRKLTLTSVIHTLKNERKTD